MCEKCVEFDKKITHLKLLAIRVTDEPMLDGIQTLIDQHEARKRELHPEGEGEDGPSSDV